MSADEFIKDIMPDEPREEMEVSEEEKAYWYWRLNFFLWQPFKLPLALRRDQFKNQINYMQYTHFFQWNIPAENEITGRTNSYIDVIAKFDGQTFYNDGEPMVSIYGANLSFCDCLKVKNWLKAHNDIEKVARQHFAEIARMEKINQARAVLACEENPVTERLVLNHFTPLS